MLSNVLDEKLGILSNVTGIPENRLREIKKGATPNLGEKLILEANM